MYLDKKNLIRKYNIPGPRYTSYPTVPYWDNSTFSPTKWERKIQEIFSNSAEELSIYIHLPYCESLCTFCGCNTRITKNHQVEQPYIDYILKEWMLYNNLMAEKPVISEMHLGGGTPTFFSPQNLERLMKGIFKDYRIKSNAELGFEGHPNNTTLDHLKTLSDQGFRRVSYGIQDFDPKVQTAINRIQKFENVVAATENARKAGYTSINFDLVFGLPFQTLHSLDDTIGKVKLLMPDRIAFYSYAHVPWIKPGQRKFTEMDLPDDDEKRALYEHGRELLEDAGYIEIGMDHFALPTDTLYKAEKNGILHRNFMGYTSMKSTRVIGMGVSAIGDMWEAYGQNVKTVEDYKSKLDNDELPVYRGHFLNKEDLILRNHILNIMCRLETSWLEPSMQHESVFASIERLLPLADDGLVIITPDSIKVTEAGKTFIRNICMAFDQKLHNKATSQVQFSKVI